MKKIVLIKSIIILIILSCSSKGQNEKEQILSLVFNNQIGNEELFGQAPPISPLAPNFEELERFESIEIAKKNLQSVEWKEFFKEDESYEARVAAWKKRMKSLKRRIIFFNKSKMNKLHEELAKQYVNKYGFENDFLDTPTNWDKSDIQNVSEYKIVNYTDFPDLKLDSINVGILQFSEIGFNKEKNKAILYYDWLCGGHCGNGNLAILKKEKNTWKIEEILNLWVS
ncbi:MAG: hypothetical protein P8Q41_13670 [Saprospiraceae bacterium]|nr:hypothetical protein [Saprospiraceae bacterium]